MDAHASRQHSATLYMLDPMRAESGGRAMPEDDCAARAPEDGTAHSRGRVCCVFCVRHVCVHSCVCMHNCVCVVCVCAIACLQMCVLHICVCVAHVCVRVSSPCTLPRLVRCMRTSEECRNEMKKWAHGAVYGQAAAVSAVCAAGATR